MKDVIRVDWVSAGNRCGKGTCIIQRMLHVTDNPYADRYSLTVPNTVDVEWAIKLAELLGAPFYSHNNFPAINPHTAAGA